jgi:hypothetical protein
MAEQLSGTELTKPTAQPVREFMGVPVEPPGLDGGYKITIKRFNAAGTAHDLVAWIPEKASPAAIRDNPVLLTAVLKDGDPTWQPYEPGFILVAALKAAGLGLDLLEGDIYPVQGRLGISDWAKIKYARSHGYRAVVAVKQGPPVQWEWSTNREKGIWTGTNDEYTAQVYDKNDKLVNTYTTTLKAWFVGSSKEWRDRTAESLRRKALARAYQEVCPIGIDPEEAPPIEIKTPFPQGFSGAAATHDMTPQSQSPLRSSQAGTKL